MDARTTQLDLPPTALAETDAARYIGMTTSYLRAARVGRCEGPPYVRLGRSVRYLVTDLDAYVQERRVTRQARG